MGVYEELGTLVIDSTNNVNFSIFSEDTDKLGIAVSMCSRCNEVKIEGSPNLLKHIKNIRREAYVNQV